jgi:DNA polymerase-4
VSAALQQWDDRPRHVLHVTTDDFFAALARQRDPALRQRPVVVGNLLNRGSVVSASYEAREAGVHPGLTMQQASRLAPDAALVQVDWGHARHASQALLRLVQGYGARVEPHGFDEAYRTIPAANACTVRRRRRAVLAE